MLFLLHEIVREMMRRRATRRLAARLAAMTDRQLDDIAVARGDIAAVAARSYPRPAFERVAAPRFTLDALPIAG